MKNVVLIASAVLFFQSCEKCSECHYDFNETEVEMGEYCGEDLENIEKSGFDLDGTNYEVHCNEH